MEIWEMYTKFESEHAEVRDHCGDEGTNIKIILKWIVEKQGGGYDMDHCLALVNFVKSLLEFATHSISRMTVFHVVSYCHRGQLWVIS
jgi:hypothetical protein